MRKADRVVKQKIAEGFQKYASGTSRNSGAAYQLAFCYATGFGVPFEPQEAVKWLEIAAMGGSPAATRALPRFRQVFDDTLRDYVIPSTEAMKSLSLESHESYDKVLPTITGEVTTKKPSIEFRTGAYYVDGNIADAGALLLEAARTCEYDKMVMLLSNGARANVCTDEGVTALHFISSWDLANAMELGRRLVLAGSDINASARKGSRPGEPL